ncbi:DNA (cytosine-5-)-methyltransferase [Streptacidiphilus sp. ASG 303]|uniref:DNA cytosine methyltransferase n=1 Tax=Streptacidiphilus sp. ASG 303 TaxID=2896847 RepID=UPI001E3C1AF3|nr:DNA (cytosine-5-)-methyltransferase [Streptacidiphilus sp. ASG 303]MCD0486169.1 DNA (cytosine-5-)-methyltransferase [Streptacidiphilus sp. ASG 303]
MVSGDRTLTSIEICAGAGGQAVGLHSAGFRHLALVEIDKHAVETLKLNVARRKEWAWEREHCKVLSMDVKEFRPFSALSDSGLERGQLDLLAGGVPCPPFSIAGKQLGQDDERDLFPTMLDLVDELRPRAVMIENVRGLLQPDYKFKGYREQILGRLRSSGYVGCGWKVLEARDYGVPQLRPRAILVAIRKDCYRGFDWPDPTGAPARTVADALAKSMRRRFKDNPEMFKLWLKQARTGSVAPTLVGGSKKHGGADLGPTRAKAAWKQLGIDAMGVANDEDSVVPERDLYGDNGPKLTVGQAALIQGFPEDWEFFGGKTARYRQVGNAFPPPVAEAVGRSIAEALGRTGPLWETPQEEREQVSLFSAGLVAPQDLGTPAGDRVEDAEGALV